VELVWRAYDHLTSEGISPRALEDTRAHLKGSLLLGMETVASQMSRLATHEMHFGRHIETTEILERLDAITLDDVHRMAETYWSRDKTLLVGLGPLEGL
jgi:predicted Zn-dependent peptidase